MNWKRYLNGQLSWYYAKWNGRFDFHLDRYWGGRIFHLNISKLTIVLDCRKNWLEDMATGKIA